ncbi:MAG: tetraacyldisaccharide 4'-kinase [bacterium]|nr:tetraacyldisaccharide 4'-kinase [Candidatus Sumerlaeota bacterium]
MLTPAAGIYTCAVAIKRSLYGAGVMKARAAALPVVCVGNLTVGGTGKTPMVEYVARALIVSGHRPAIVSRGYKRATPHDQLVIVSDGRQALASAAEGGDEPVLLARSLPGVPVAVCADRLRACAAVAETGLCDCIVLDDGFQHWRLARDADIVLIDATADLGRLRLLPAGPLREPLTALRRAAAIVHTKIPPPGAARGSISFYVKNHAIAAQFAPRIPQFAATFHADTIVPLERYVLENAARNDVPDRPAESLLGRKLLAFAGIAQPENFFGALRELADRVHEIAFNDHHSFSKDDIHSLAVAARGRNCGAIVTTAKDAVKIAPFAAIFTLPVFVLLQRIELDDAASFLRLIIDSLNTTGSRSANCCRNMPDGVLADR